MSALARSNVGELVQQFLRVQEVAARVCFERGKVALSALQLPADYSVFGSMAAESLAVVAFLFSNCKWS